MSISGGVSWENVISPLKKVSTAWVVVYLFYISFTYFAVLNVVTADTRMHLNLCIASRLFDLGGVFCFDDIVGDLTCVGSATLSNHASLCLPQVFCQSAIEGAQNDHASRVHAILANKAHCETQECCFFFARVDSCKVLFYVFTKHVAIESCIFLFS